MKDDDYEYYEAEQSPRESLLQLKDLLPALLMRWYWLLLGLLLGLGFGFYQAWKSVPVFQSQATVLVRDYSVSVLQTVDAAEFDLRSNAALETIRAGLMKYELCERVASEPKVRSLKALMPPSPKKLFQTEKEEPSEPVTVPPSPQLAGMIRSWLNVSLQPQSRLMSIAVQHPDPKVAAIIANAVVDEYIEQRAEVKELGKSKSFDLLEAQGERLKGELSNSKMKLSIYETPNRAELALVTAEQELNSMKLRYRPKHPKYVEALRKVELAKEQLRATLQRAVVNPTDSSYWEQHASAVAGLEQE